MRKHLTYANVTATLALVFAMSGGALAARHYLINSTKQINPKVLKALRGKSGPQGPKGESGSRGERGEKGEIGPKGETGPSHAFTAEGVSEASVTVPAGDYAVTGGGNFEDVGAKPGDGECWIEGPPGKTFDFHWASVSPTGAITSEKKSHGYANITNETAIQLSSAGQILERCRQDEESEEKLRLFNTTVTAILVGAIN